MLLQIWNVISYLYDMRNFLNFHTTSQKSENFTSLGSFCPKYMRFEQKKIQKSYHSWYWTVMQNLNKPRPCGFKSDMRNWVNFHCSTQKSEKWYIDGIFSSKAYNVSARRFQRNYVSWHWRVMQKLKEN